jgi:hypothetical protein
MSGKRQLNGLMTGKRIWVHTGARDEIRSQRSPMQSLLVECGSCGLETCLKLSLQ